MPDLNTLTAEAREAMKASEFQSLWECPIMSFPDEIMLQILEHATHIPELEFRDLDGSFQKSLFLARVVDMKNLAWTCRRFRRLATPFLYSWLPVGHSNASTLLLHRTLKEDPSLRPLCKSLVIISSEPALDAAREDILSFLGTTIRSLHIQNIGTPANAPTPPRMHAWNQVRATLPKMCQLERLILSEDGDGVGVLGLVKTSIYSLFQGGFPPSLRQLRVHDGGRQSLQRRSFLPTPLKDARPKTAPFTDLSVRSFQGPACFDELIRWPATLKKLTIEELGQGRHPPVLNLRQIWSHAMVHCQCLTHLRVGNLVLESMADLDRALFHVDFSYFTSLASLSLSLSATGTNPDRAAKLIAPRLETFEWTFPEPTVPDGPYLNSFAWREEEFLRRFAREAVEKQPDPRALRRIKVDFVPTLRFDPRSLLQPMYLSGLTAQPSYQSSLHASYEYPWDRLDRIAEEVLGHGIRLVYNKPAMTKAEFEEYQGNFRGTRGHQATGVTTI
ncbi:hypothetical protein QBC35DRAFT_453385 [Podospora australis]|uniref:F-box domain-containing protein n=1 Tax=Podospora australis TaxID=1536484 RepID=A0AAN6WQL0_9PEZI|nr:hypothetical protein QBC35DRAFT_453385 [Podospora australis]